MNPDIFRMTSKAGAAYHWAFMASIRDQQEQVAAVHLLMGIQLANPHLLAGVDSAKLDLATLDLGDEEAIQNEMQKRFMRAQLLAARESSSGQFGIHSTFDHVARQALEFAQKCAERFETKETATIHLLYGIFTADPQLRAKMERAGLSEARLVSLCQDYIEGDEGERLGAEAAKYGRSFRSGIGYDLHRLAEGRKLIIGGIEVPFEKGPVGHSDGDVVAHALCDALLGAAGFGDIGTHFPDSDPKWKGANSLLFLEHARRLLDEKQFAIEYADVVVILEHPKLGPHFPKMRDALAKALRVPAEKIHLKAKTNEGVDAVGRGEAIACHVVATISTN